jgi:hypothetical protein
MTKSRTFSEHMQQMAHERLGLSVGHDTAACLVEDRRLLP